jgi:hypothetical protein
MQRNQWRWRRTAALAGATLVTLVTAPARSEPATPADGAFENVERLVRGAYFDEAERAAGSLLASGDLGRRDVARVHLELGIIAAARANESLAERAFVRALRLEPSMELPPSAGPHVASAFQRAKDRVSGEPGLEVSVTFERVDSELEVRVAPQGSPEGLIDGVEVKTTSVRRKLRFEKAEPPFRVRMELASGTCDALTVTVTDDHGNPLWPDVARFEPCPARQAALPPAESARPPAAIVQAPMSPKPDEPERPVPTYVWIGTVATAGLAITTMVVGIGALDKTDEYNAKVDDPDLSEESKRDLRESAQNAQTRATVLGITTGVVGVATLVLYFVRPEAPKVTAFVAPGTAFVGVDGRF